MIQKRFLSVDLKEYEESLNVIADLKEYAGASSVLLQLYVECWDEDVIKEIISMTSMKLPFAHIVGMTSVNREVYDLSDTDMHLDLNLNSIMTEVLIFESSYLNICVYDSIDTCEYTAGGRISQMINEVDDVKGVELFVADDHTHVEDFLAMASAFNDSIPFFGAKAMVMNTMTGVGKSIVFYDGGMITKGIVAVIFSGAELNIRTGYCFGWTAMGKKMTITKMENELVVSGIDNKPATHVYRKYLGLAPDQIVSENVCEFPFCVKRGERLLARIASRTDDPEKMIFSAPMFEGDEIQLSYGNPDIIFAESYADAMEVRRFSPQALKLISCMNRSIVLGEDVSIERSFYAPALLDMTVVHGSSEILMDKDGGGELASSLVSVAMREGAAPSGQPWIEACTKEECSYHSDIIPIVHRLTHFMEAVTGDLAEAVEEANAANEAKSRFLSSVSHEIRTPINAVLGLDEMILRESTEPGIRRYAMDIQNSGRTLLSLINDILDSSRIASGRIEILPIDYELSSLLNDLVNMTAVSAEEKGLSLNVNVDPRIPHALTGDDTRIRQCALNILTNAVKYTNTGSVTMDVSFKKTSSDSIDLEFAVTDTGIGIKSEDIDRLFVAFDRIEEQRNHGIEGTGLGINIVTSLLALMGSELKVESEYGKGSVFSFVISQKVVNWEPVGDFTEMYKKSVNEMQNYHESFHAPDARILVVDDTRVNLTVIRGLLKATGIRIDTAESGREALALVRKNLYDIIFLDQRMPQMDGIETFRRMKHDYENRNHGAPVVMLTANAVAGAREMFLEEGFDDYLAKPVNGKKLEAMIRALLPEEKLLEPDGFGLSEQSDKDSYESPFLKGLSGIKGLSVKEGLANCMNEEILRSTISDFVAGAKSGLSEISGYLESGNISDYTIKVHALKSSARIIGADSLSEQARQLESLGDEGDIKSITEHTPKLLSDYKALSQSLESVLKGYNDTDGLSSEDGREELPKDQLESALGSIRELIEAFDFDGAADIVDMLEGYRLPEEDKLVVDAVYDHIKRLERDEILKILKNS